MGLDGEADLCSVNDKSVQSGNEQTIGLDRSGFGCNGWSVHSQCRISRIECETNENENEHLI